MPVGYMGAGYLGIAKQGAAGGTQGTPTAPTSFAPFTGETFNANPRVTRYRNGTKQGVAYSVVNDYQVAVGQSGIPFTSNFGAQVLYLVTGGTDTKTGAGDPYSHALSFANDLPWFTTERFFADQNYGERIQDCKMNKVTVSGKASDMVMLSWDAIGLYNPKQNSAATITYDADPPFMFRDGAFTINGTSSLVQVAGFSVEVSRNLQPVFTNKVYPQYLVPRTRDIAVTMDLVWDTSNAPTWYQNIVKAGSTTTPTVVPYQGSATFLIDPGATPDHQLSIAFTDLREITATPKLNPSNLDVQMVTISAFAQIPSGGGDEVTFTIKNLTSTAYSA